MTYTAYKNGWIAVDPFAGFHVKFKYADRRYLSASELQAVMDVELPNYKTGINRDVFVFCAFTGLSHSDVAKLTHADITRTTTRIIGSSTSGKRQVHSSVSNFFLSPKSSTSVIRIHIA